jgi:hypothetical protein
MPERTIHPIDPSRIMLDFLERVSLSETLVEVVVAAGVAREELLGLPSEPYPAEG